MKEILAIRTIKYSNKSKKDSIGLKIRYKNDGHKTYVKFYDNDLIKMQKPTNYSETSTNFNIKDLIELIERTCL